MSRSVEGDTRKRLVDAAEKLFYREGIGRVSVDAVAAEAGFTKRTLYYHFASKDDLVAAYLERRDAPNLAAYRGWFEVAEGGIEMRIETLFLHLEDLAARPSWRGCGFLRTAAELVALPGHPAVRVASTHKRALETWLAGELARERVADPPLTARQVVLLLDGAFADAMLHKDPSCFAAAGRAAATVVRAARLKGLTGSA